MLLNRNFSLVFILCILAPCLFAQTIVLTLDEAINLVKKNNPTISINKINEEIARMQVYKANVGMTPNLDWNFNANSSFNYVNQQFFDGRNINRFGRAIAPNTNLALSYPIYDGGLMKTRLQILEEEANRVKISNADIEEQLVDAVIQNYYLMSRQQAAIDFLKSNMNYYNERLKITSERWNLGKGSKLDYLQSQNDYNT
jgi:outer membrane protein